MEKQHVTILKTKGKDLIDGEPYLKMFGKLNLGRIQIKQVTMSVVGSFNGKEYFNEFAQ